MTCEFRDPKDIGRDLWIKLLVPILKFLGFVSIVGSMLGSMTYVDYVSDNDVLVEGWLWIPYVFGFVTLYLSLALGGVFVILLLVFGCIEGKDKAKEIFCKNP